MQIEISVDGLEEAMARFDAFDDVALDEFRKAMGLSVQIVGKYAREKAPVNLGKLRASITGKVQDGGIGVFVEGIVGAYQPYGQVMEEGADPHWPNMANLHFWVVRKLGLEGAAALQATFLIARAISRRGLKGRYYMRDGMAQAEPEVQRQFEDAVRRIVERLGDE